MRCFGRQRSRWSTLVVLTALTAVSVTSHAANKDRLNERISASACQPRNSADRALITWTGLDWEFKAGEEGTVLLECPVFTPFEDEEEGTRELSELRLWYRDSDGMSNAARIQASLRFVDGTTGVLASVLEGSVDSNGSSTTTQTTRATSLSNATMSDGQYFVVVTMFRNDTTKTLRFRGVSFFEKP